MGEQEEISTSKYLGIKLDIDPILNSIADFTITEDGRKEIIHSEFDRTKENSEYLQNLTEQAKNYLINGLVLNIEFHNSLIPILSKLTMSGVVLQPEEFLQIKKHLFNVKTLKKQEHFKKECYNLIYELISKLFYDFVIEKEISDTINDIGEIRDSASRELSDIRNAIRENKSKIGFLAEKLIKKYDSAGIIQENFITIKDERIVLPIKTEFKRQIKGFIHSESSSGATTFIEPEEILELNNEILSLSFKEKREIERILRLLSKRISVYREDLYNSNVYLSEIDSCFAKAKYATLIKANKVNFSNDEIFLINCRHPALIKKLGYEKTVPFTLKLENKERCLVISGPNAGGKTVFMKTVGVISLLSKIGVQIPFDPDSTLMFFDKIFIDIGDEQSIENDISTFSSHINRLNYIYNYSDNSSLVLLDEIGTGTDPKDGVALAAGIIKAFLEKGSFVITTTHHGNIKSFAETYPGCINCSMDFDLNSLNPSYKFIQGVPGNSFAFEIAKKQKLNKIIIDYSSHFRNNEEVSIENYIKKLQKTLKEYRTIINQNIRKKTDLNQKLKEIDDKLKEINLREAKLKKNDVSEAFNYLKNANALIEKTIKAIKESNADSRVIKESKKEIEVFTKNITSESIKIVNSASEIYQIGDMVINIEKNIKGEIIEISEDKRYVIIQAGQIKFKTLVDEIKKDFTLEKSFSSANYKKNFVQTSFLPVRLDLLGKRGYEAEDILLKYLDQISINNIQIVEILHGKGEGILRKLVKNILDQHPSVEKYYPAPIEMGGDGVTIVKFKD